MLNDNKVNFDILVGHMWNMRRPEREEPIVFPPDQSAHQQMQMEIAQAPPSIYICHHHRVVCLNQDIVALQKQKEAFQGEKNHWKLQKDNVDVSTPWTPPSPSGWHQWWPLFSGQDSTQWYPLSQKQRGPAVAQCQHALGCDQHPPCMVMHRVQTVCGYTKLKLPHVEKIQSESLLDCVGDCDSKRSEDNCCSVWMLVHKHFVLWLFAFSWGTCDFLLLFICIFFLFGGELCGLCYKSE